MCVCVYARVRVCSFGRCVNSDVRADQCLVLEETELLKVSRVCVVYVCLCLCVWCVCVCVSVCIVCVCSVCVCVYVCVCMCVTFAALPFAFSGPEMSTVRE